MSEQRAPYHTPYHYSKPENRTAYPGSHLELLAEALDTLETEAPESYDEYSTIHQAIEEVLGGSVAPLQLMEWLLQSTST